MALSFGEYASVHRALSVSVDNMAEVAAFLNTAYGFEGTENALIVLNDLIMTPDESTVIAGVGDFVMSSGDVIGASVFAETFKALP